MLRRMFCRFEGVAIIHLYNEKGEKIGEFAELKFTPLFSWWLFLLGFIPGLVIIGHNGG
jgi:hypothetical protein